VASRMEQRQVPTSSVTVTPGSAEAAPSFYEVRIGPGLLRDISDWLLQLVPARRYAVIADSNTAPLYGASLVLELTTAGLPSDLLEFPAGEASKTRHFWADLSDRMLLAQHGRDSAVLALGGGVTGDLAGFVAATYMRGLPYVQLPTSLLAMIDSSVGGKTGVDTPAGKNLIGSFHQPIVVVADVETLRTLPERELRAGAAEAIKHGAIADEAYFEWLRDSATEILQLAPASIGDLIRRSVELKAAVVGADEREHGLRKILNFGHTVGHAIEALSGFRLLHGEAIGMGMIVEGLIGESLGITAAGTTDRLREALALFGLPITVPSTFSSEGVLAATRTDKKARSGVIEYSLIERIGTASRGGGSYGTPVEDATVAMALETARD
jgi:3-dehydroquinate synthase